MLQIVNVYTYVSKRNGMTITVLQLSNGTTVHTTAARLARKGINDANALIGGGTSITVMFYAAGDELRDGTVVTDSNKLVRDFAITKGLNLLMADKMAAMMMASMGLTVAPTAQVAGVGNVNTETGEVDEDEVEPERETGDAVAAAAEADAVKVVEKATKDADLPI